MLTVHAKRNRKNKPHTDTLNLPIIFASVISKQLLNAPDAAHTTQRLYSIPSDFYGFTILGVEMFLCVIAVGLLDGGAKVRRRAL